MALNQDVTRRMPTSKDSADEAKETPRRTAKMAPRTGFLDRRVRLFGDSSLSMPLALVLLFPCLVVVVIFTLFARSPDSDELMNMPAGSPPFIRKISERYDKPFAVGCLEPRINAPRANAAFVVLARNQELEGVIQSVKSIERHFNRWYHYPYVFLNDGIFNETFKETIMNYTSAPVEWGQIAAEDWGWPEWLDPAVAKEGIARQGDDAIMYGGMESYHHMCRFYSGKFYNHDLLRKYAWYWRLEPDIKYFCDITYDPFIHMERHNKTYGFTIAVKELRETVPNIWRYASAFKRNNKIKSQGLWEMFVAKPRQEGEEEPIKKGQKPKKPVVQEDLESDTDTTGLPKIDPENMEGESYNMCHFWSNFEIARLDWFRSKEYNDFFETMDRSGGFWMERWGDAPIHSLAAGLLLGPGDIHYFRDIGYRHTTIQHCPANAPARQLAREPYLEMTTLDEKARREEDRYWATPDAVKENGVGCRCKCDTDIADVEGKEGSCLAEWVEVAGGWATPAQQTR
ncbi:nucleotide-diphospho-sugar transferase [Phaeosphaeria sp. MPI-PUGE-AT-0046c]|nr:nucleotide-diphospho-sugar transferase [Phaeosphaeria sp. MPI-PUGE-AT-0046c]